MGTKRMINGRLKCCTEEMGTKRTINGRKIPLGTWLLEKLGLCNCCPKASHKIGVYFLTVLCYTTYLIARKSFSVVKVVLCPRCAGEGNNSSNESFNYGNYTYDVGSGDSPFIPGWHPFNGPNGQTLLGFMDFCLVLAYSISMFVSGQIADRVNLRYFLTVGMIGSGIAVSLLGVAYFANIQHLAYFIVVQILSGIMQSTGWTGIAAVNGNWFGKQSRGLLMGIWASLTAIGNIPGAIIPSFWATTPNSPWGWSFFVPGFIVGGMGLITFFFLVTDPECVGLPPAVHHSGGVVSACNPLTIQEGIQTTFTVMGKEEDGSQTLEEWEKEQKIAELGHSPTAGRHKIWSFTPTHSPVLGRRTDPNSHHVLNVTNLVMIQLEGEEERDEAKGGGGGGGGGRGKGGERGEEMREGEGVDQQVNGKELQKQPKKKAIGFFRALLIPGVIEFSIALFFNKLVSFTFFFWLPLYVKASYPNLLSAEQADWLSTLFDVGGFIGGIIIGVVSDCVSSRAMSCMMMLFLAVPSLFLLNFFGGVHLAAYSVLLIACGACINGPYQIITSAVSTDLATSKSLKDDQKAKATVAAIINGTGSLGAAFGPLIVGWLTDQYDWTSAFYLLMSCCFLSAVLLSRLVIKESIRWIRNCRLNHLDQHETAL